MPRYKRSLASKSDYLEIWLYVAEQSQSVNAADRVVSSFDEKLSLLASHPGMGPSREDIGPGLRTFPVGSYLLIYRVIRNSIELVRVVHGSRDLRQLFRRRKK